MTPGVLAWAWGEGRGLLKRRGLEEEQDWVEPLLRSLLFQRRARVGAWAKLMRAAGCELEGPQPGCHSVPKTLLCVKVGCPPNCLQLASPSLITRLPVSRGPAP